MANNSGLSKRAALRQQQELEQRAKRNRRIVGVGLGVVGLVVVVILGIVVAQTLSDRSAVAGSQDEPPNATAEFGIEAVSTGESASGDAPLLVIYQDYQCPGCAQSEQVYGPAVSELLDAGEISVEYRTAFFLDDMLQNDSSKRAAMAAAAADAVGKYREYHEAVFANQPAEEGVGYTDQQLRIDFPEAAGIAGDDLATFQQLYDDQVFDEFTTSSDEAFKDSGFTSTRPTRSTAQSWSSTMSQAKR